MKLAVEFASVAYREGTDGITRLAKGIEDIGYDQLDVYDHVVMGYDDVPGRAKSYYPSQMPILEAFVMLAYAAAVTDRIGLGTEVLVLPQRQPALVAKQVSTLDTLSNGRVRLGVGIGWQESEYEALGENFRNRGKRMDEAMGLLRTIGARTIDFESALPDNGDDEPKSPQGADLPIWAAATHHQLSSGKWATALASCSRCRRKKPWTISEKRRWLPGAIRKRSAGRA